MTKTHGVIYKLAKENPVLNAFLEGSSLMPSPEMELAKSMQELAKANEALAKVMDERANQGK